MKPPKLGLFHLVVPLHQEASSGYSVNWLPKIHCAGSEIPPGVRLTTGKKFGAVAGCTWPFTDGEFPSE